MSELALHDAGTGHDTDMDDGSLDAGAIDPVTGSPAAAVDETTVAATGAVLASLTGLRWIAALIVFLFHCRNLQFFQGRAEPLAIKVVGNGSVGVSFFFVLSGFVLAWSAKPSPQPMRFWRARIARVWPLHLATLVIAVVLAEFAVPGVRRTDTEPLLANVFLISAWHHPWWQAGNPVSWTLTCEAFFYLSFPLLFLALRRAWTWLVALTAAASVLAIVVLARLSVTGTIHVHLDTFPPVRLPEFVIGVATAILVSRRAWHGPPVWLAAGITVLGYAFSTVVARPYAISALTIVGFSLLVPAVAGNDLAGRRSILRSRVMVRLGEWSFAFYLVHLFVLRLFVRFSGHGRSSILGGVLLAGAALACAILAAWTLHLAVERPMRRVILQRRRAVAS